MGCDSRQVPQPGLEFPQSQGLCRVCSLRAFFALLLRNVVVCTRAPRAH